MAHRLTNRRTFVVGVGMTKFEKPLTKKWDYPEMGSQAAADALHDAGLTYNDLQAAVASYCYGDPTCGQRALYELGLTGIPVFNTNNNCSSASSALMLARALVLSGYDCTIAVGFEKMDRGLSEKYTDKTSPIKNHTDTLVDLGADPKPLHQMNAVTSDVIKMFAYAARDHSKHHGTTVDQYAKVTYKNRRHGAMNDRACFQSPVTLDFIKTKRELCYPITFPMSAPTADGGAAAIVCSEEFVNRHNLQDKAIEILSQHMVTDLPSSFGQSFLNLCGYSMSKKAAEKCLQDAGIVINDIDIIELHDCFAPNELFLYEALGLCPEGHGGKLIDSSKWVKNKNGGEICVIGGRWVVNTSGGLESKGHPIGATGLGQCAELIWQLRGEAGKRQVDNARIGLQQNFGIGGAAVVTLYGKFDKNNVPQARL